MEKHNVAKNIINFLEAKAQHDPRARIIPFEKFLCENQPDVVCETIGSTVSTDQKDPTEWEY